MTILITVVHVIACIILVLVVLLQAGKDWLDRAVGSRLIIS